MLGLLLSSVSLPAQPRQISTPVLSPDKAAHSAWDSERLYYMIFCFTDDCQKAIYIVQTMKVNAFSVFSRSSSWREAENSTFSFDKIKLIVGVFQFRACKAVSPGGMSHPTSQGLLVPRTCSLTLCNLKINFDIL